MRQSLTLNLLHGLNVMGCDCYDEFVARIEHFGVLYNVTVAVLEVVLNLYKGLP